MPLSVNKDSQGAGGEIDGDGRVKKPHRNASLSIRFTEEELALIAVKAAEIGKTPSGFIRMCALQAGEITPFIGEQDAYILGAIADDMRKIGVNLNQVARAINSGRVPHADEMTIVLQSVVDVVRVHKKHVDVMLHASARATFPNDQVAMADNAMVSQAAGKAAKANDVAGDKIDED